METRKPTLDELTNYFYNDRKRFDELAKYYYEHDTSFYKEVISSYYISPPPFKNPLPRLDPTKTRPEKSNNHAVIVVLIVVLIILLLGFIFYLKTNQTEISNVETTIEKTDFETAIIEFETGRFERAKTFFEKVNANDSNYKKAQEYLVKCDEKIEQKQKDAERQEKIDKLRDAEKKKLDKKYNQIFGGRGWLHEKQSKLASLGFREYKTGIEKAHDGSQQIKTYYKKWEKEYDIYVHVALQYSYSLEHHYVNVWVE